MSGIKLNKYGRDLRFTMLFPSGLKLFIIVTIIIIISAQENKGGAFL